MATFRNVTANIENSEGTPLANYPISVTHLQGNHAPSGEYFPPFKKLYFTNSLGVCTFPIWANEEGEENSRYRFILGANESFETVVPAGNGDISLGVLKEISILNKEIHYMALVNFVSDELIGRGFGTTPLATTILAGKVKVNSVTLDPIVYTKSEVDSLLAAATGADLTNYLTASQTNSAIASAISAIPPVNLSAYYTSAQVNSALALKADVATSYTKTQVDSLIAGVSGADLSAYYTIPQTNSAIASAISAIPPVNLSAYYTSAQVDARIDNLTFSTDLPGLTDVTISSPLSGQSLVYQSGQWVNQTISGGTPSSPGNITNIIYDGQNRISSYTLNGVGFSTVYNATTTVITGGGNTRTLTYNANGLLISDITI
jgi:hypothetical protein